MSDARDDVPPMTLPPIDVRDVGRSDDVLLRVIVNAVNQSSDADTGIDLVLLVQGAWVAGRLVSVTAFFKTLDDTMGEASLNLSVAMAPLLEASRGGGDDDEPVPAFAHLLNAFVMSGSQRLPSAGGHPLRIKLESIDGWMFGSVTTVRH